MILISQSGETADTLAALREGKARGAKNVAICNVVDSSIAREANGVIYTHAGPEIGVASTKAFVTQLAALYLFTIRLGRAIGTHRPGRRGRRMIASLVRIPALLEKTLELNAAGGKGRPQVHECPRFPLPRPGHQLPHRPGRGPEAEGDLLHPCRGVSGRGDEAWPHRPHRREHAGGGPRAAGTPTTKRWSPTWRRSSPAAAGSSRSAPPGTRRSRNKAEVTLEIPVDGDDLTPILLSVPLQLLAYHVAVLKGTDVDQPRNLAKSVTVE